MQRIQTKRLLLRPFRESDYDDLFELLSQLKDDEFEGYPGITYENGREHLKYRLGSEEFYAIELPDSGKVIGNIYCGNRDCATKEVGYIVNKRYRQKGYAAEALSAVIRQTFAEGAHRIYAECDPRNTPSWKLLEKVGMRREAHFRRNIWFHRDENGAPVWKDTLVYAMLENEDRRLVVRGKTYRILRLLGHGKGGYSWLADCDGQRVVVKQIHHEPCDYYAFGNKIEAERRDYERLLKAGIRMPALIAIDEEAEIVVKEYVAGNTAFELVRDGIPMDPYLAQVREMAAQAKAAGLNIDYFPTNFVLRDGLIWYVDYECNDYMEKWSFENWGIRYWFRTPEFLEYLKQQADDASGENNDRDSQRTADGGRIH